MTRVGVCLRQRTRGFSGMTLVAATGRAAITGAVGSGREFATPPFASGIQSPVRVQGQRETGLIAQGRAGC